jgi:hypothetical protein
MQRAIWSRAIRKRYKRALKKYRLLQEIVSTEKTYLCKLSEIVNGYLLPLQKGAEETHRFSFTSSSAAAAAVDTGLSSEEIKAMFSQIQVIYLYHQNLYEDISARACEPQFRLDATTERITISCSALLQKLQSFSQFMRCYIEYVNSYNRSLQTLERCATKNSKFMAFCAERQKKNGGESLASLLITPIQRIPRYVLLLQSVLQETSVHDPEFSLLTDTTTMLRSLATQINERKRTEEAAERIHRLYLRLYTAKHGEILEQLFAPHRRLLHEGALWLRREGGSSKRDDEWCVVCIFCDLFLICQTEMPGTSTAAAASAATSPHLKLRWWIHARVDAVKPLTFRDDEEESATDSEQPRYAFMVSVADRTFMFRASSDAEARAWIAQFAELAKYQKAQLKHKLVSLSQRASRSGDSEQRNSTAQKLDAPSLSRAEEISGVVAAAAAAACNNSSRKKRSLSNDVQQMQQLHSARASVSPILPEETCNVPSELLSADGILDMQTPRSTDPALLPPPPSLPLPSPLQKCTETSVSNDQSSMLVMQKHRLRLEGRARSMSFSASKPPPLLPSSHHPWLPPPPPSTLLEMAASPSPSPPPPPPLAVSTPPVPPRDTRTQDAMSVKQRAQRFMSQHH